MKQNRRIKPVTFGMDVLIEDPRDVMLLARKALATRVRQAQNLVHPRWSPAPEAERTVVDLNELFPLVKAWTRQNTYVAQDLVRSAFSLQGTDGALPRRFTPDGPVVDGLRPWPLIAQAALEVWNAKPDPKFLQRMLPALRRYGEWVLASYHPDPEQPPQWKAGEAFLPDLWEPGMACVDLTAFLLAEIEALCVLEREAHEFDAAQSSRWNIHRQNLALALEKYFWNEETRRYTDRSPNGRFITRRTISELMPLLWIGLPAPRKAQVVRAATRRTPLLKEYGFVTWEAWKEDRDAPPMAADAQFMAMEALLRAGALRLADVLARRWRTRFEAYWRLGLSLPEDLSAPEGRVALRPSIASFLPTWPVCLIIASDTLASSFERERNPVRHGLTPRQWATLYISMIVGFALLLTVAGLMVHGRKTVPFSVFETYANLGRQYYEQKKYEDAVKLFQDMRNRVERPPATLDLLLGNALYRTGRYEEAITAYRRVNPEEKASVYAYFNQALSLYQLGRKSEALVMLERFVKAYSTFVPELAVRAQRAIELIKSQDLIGLSPASLPLGDTTATNAAPANPSTNAVPLQP